MVVVQVLPNYNSQHVLTSGTEGEFRVEHLEPGQWQVVSMRSPMTEDFDPQSGDDMGDMLSDLKLAVVKITDGEETHVILGQPPEDAIEVSGTVVHDGEPVGGVMLNFLPEGSAGMGDLKMVMCKDDGSFSTTLDRRGPYLIRSRGMRTSRAGSSFAPFRPL